MSEDNVSVPVEVLDLLRFMCNTWTDIDKWAHKNMTVNSLGDYPQIQGTSNQINLHRIGEQPYNIKNLNFAVEWMKENNAPITALNHYKFCNPFHKAGS